MARKKQTTWAYRMPAPEKLRGAVLERELAEWFEGPASVHIATDGKLIVTLSTHALPEAVENIIKAHTGEPSAEDLADIERRFGA